MPIRPFDLQQSEANIPDELREILVEAGVSSPKIEENEKKTKTRQIFDDSGGSVKAAAKNIASVMSNGENENARLKASEMILKVHGVLQEIDDKPVPEITININGQGNKTLVNLVLPSI